MPADSKTIDTGLCSRHSLPLASREPRPALTAAIGHCCSARGHASGWPVAKGGSQGHHQNALSLLLRSLGGDQSRTGFRLEKLSQLAPHASGVLFDLTPPAGEQIMATAGPCYGPQRSSEIPTDGVPTKMDFCSSGPVPLAQRGAAKSRKPLHSGRYVEEIAAAEKVVSMGSDSPQKPYVLVAQPALRPPPARPDEKQVLLGVLSMDLTAPPSICAAIVNQIERFRTPDSATASLKTGDDTKALTKNTMPTTSAGIINGGVQDWRQFFSRPCERVFALHHSGGCVLFSALRPPRPAEGFHGIVRLSRGGVGPCGRTFRTPSANWKFSLKMSDGGPICPCYRMEQAIAVAEKQQWKYYGGS